MVMRAKNSNHLKINAIFNKNDIKKIEKDPNAYDAFLWVVIKADAQEVSEGGHYEEDDIISLDELDNEKDLADPVPIIMVDLPSSVSNLVVEAGDSEVLGGVNEPIAVKINKRNVPEGSAIMFNVIDSAGKARSVFYSVEKVQASDNQGLSHIYYLIPFTGDSDELPSTNN
jgi:hypothetical protein